MYYNEKKLEKTVGTWNGSNDDGVNRSYYFCCKHG